MTRFILTALTTIGLVALAAVGGAEEVLYARYPALSPDGSTIAFTYKGDIWTVASGGREAQRLTVHEAEDVRPHFSPDGSMILFSSRRFNNYDVFVIPVAGGAARQLTFHSAGDMGSEWFPGGDSVLFTSLREGWRDIFKVSIDGGMPIKLTGYAYEQEYNGRLTADGKYLVYNTGSGQSRWWRRDMRSSGNADIYIQDRSQAEFTSRRLTSDPRHEVWPILNRDNGDIYFVACYGDWGQVWKLAASGGEPVALTEFVGDGVQWLNSNPQGTMLVFEQGMQVWVLDPAGGQPRKVAISISTDEKQNLVEKKTFNKDVEWFSLSPDEKKIAAVIHGEVFVLPAEEPERGKRVTFTAARERFPVWGSDSKTLYYASDRNGNYDIYAADVTSLKEERLTESEENEVKPLVSPDGKYIAFYRGVDKIMRRETASGKEEIWVKGNMLDLAIEPTIEYDWSQDSKWLAFTMAGPTYETDIYAVNLEGTVHNLSRFSGYNYRPRFSHDGKQVYFSNYSGDKGETYKIDLMPKPVEFVEASFDSLFMDKPKEEKKEGDKEKKEGDKEKKEGDKEKKEPTPVTIDLQRIETRRVKAFELEASSEDPVLSQDGKKYYFVASILGKPEIWSVNADDEDPDLKQLTHSGKDKSYLCMTADSKLLFYLEDGKIRRLDTGKEKVETLSFEASMEIDMRQNQAQKFHETWQMLNSYFYDTTFHGADWKAAREKYEPALAHLRTDEEFRNLAHELMGELRASHLSIYSRDPKPVEGVLTGEPGWELDYAAVDQEGVYRVKKVFADSPADMAGIKAGQFIKKIGGRAVTRDFNANQLLAGTEGKRLDVTVSDEAGGEERAVELKPVSSTVLEELQYLDWVDERRRLVDSLSGGRLAYLHIESMNRRCLEQFRHELVSIAEKKEALIIDVRNNFGGSIAVHLLGMLVREPFMMRDFRGFPPASENKTRSKAYEKPMTLLTNDYSASNSEIFSEGFRQLKLGKVIGEPTASGVIGTASYALIDGTRVRRPSWGAYTVDMEDTDLAPRQPDIFVENLPDDFINGRDPQLVRAVRELLKELE